jgi:ADP-heptose:LPS heptosyltransferase
LIRFADRVRSIASTGLDLIGFEGIDSPALPQLRQFDSIVSWYGANRPEFRAVVADLPFQFFPALPGSGIHAVDFYMRQAGGPDGAEPKIAVPRRTDRFIAIQPFSGSNKKNWPLDKFRQLADILPYPVRFCTGPEEHLDDAVQMPDLYELACWLGTALAYVGNDSGITHLAAASGVPTVAIFRNSDPEVWAPRGRHVRILVREPSVEQVRRTIEELTREVD